MCLWECNLCLLLSGSKDISQGICTADCELFLHCNLGEDNLSGLMKFHNFGPRYFN